MTVSTSERRPTWGDATLADYDALNTMQRTPEDVFAAALKWRDTYAVYAIVELGDTDMKPAGTAYFTEAGEAWVRDIHARYHALKHDDPALIELAREWVTALGTMATINIHRTLTT